MYVTSIDARTGKALELAVEDDSAETVRETVLLARAAMPWLADLGASGRAELLDSLATALESRAADIVDVGDRETALGETRLRAELARTCFQLRFAGQVAVDGGYLGLSIDHVGSNAAGPIPDLRRTSVPIGVVAVFGASNLPLALSTPGSDTASALAAGCSVIVKAHGSHPHLTLLICDIFAETLRANAAPAGVFQVLFGYENGATLVRDPDVAAVGFTGSVAGGRALFDLASSRPDPIPFYGELGSLNPLVITPAAAAARAHQIGTGLAKSMTAVSGQLCTKPGLFFIPTGPPGDTLVGALVEGLHEIPHTHLLSSGIRDAFIAGTEAALSAPAVTPLFAPAINGKAVTPLLIAVDIDDLTQGTAVTDEHFGPFGVVVRYSKLSDVASALACLPPALTGTLHHASPWDADLMSMSRLLEARSGRIVFNDFPTGLAVAWSMHHGGQYPSSTTTSTSVGAGALNRWVRPIVFQNAPQEVLPSELRDGASAFPRRVDGVVTTAG